MTASRPLIRTRRDVRIIASCLHCSPSTSGRWIRRLAACSNSNSQRRGVTDVAVLTSTDIGSIVNAMLGVLKKGGPALEKYAESEAQKFAQSIETITGLYLAKQIDEEEATAQI